MWLGQIWRYPVKSMSGERVARATLTRLGVAGDRTVQLRNGRGQVITSRTHPQLLAHKATFDSETGEPLIDGVPWNATALSELAVKIAGRGARFVRDESEGRFDILPLLVATDGAIAAFGHDGRRLRPNLIIEGVEGLAEREWEGRRLRIGEALIQVHDLRGRCVMTTYDPDTQQQNLSVLRGIVKQFNGKLALNCSVLCGGMLHEGDTVELLPS